MSGGLHQHVDKWKNNTVMGVLRCNGLHVFLILTCPQDLDILRVISKVELVTSKGVVIVCKYEGGP